MGYSRCESLLGCIYRERWSDTGARTRGWWCCTELDLLEGQSRRGKPVILEALFDMPVSLSTWIGSFILSTTLAIVCAPKHASRRCISYKYVYKQSLTGNRHLRRPPWSRPWQRSMFQSQTPFPFPSPQSAIARRWKWTPYGRKRVCLYTFRLVRPASIVPGFWQQFSSCGD